MIVNVSCKVMNNFSPWPGSSYDFFHFGISMISILNLSLVENPSKSLRAAKKNKEKVETNCSDFSAEFFDSQSVEIFCFASKI